MSAQQSTKLSRFASQYHRPSAPVINSNGLASLRPGPPPRRNARFNSITVNSNVDGGGHPQQLANDIPLQTMTSYPGEDLDEEIADSGNVLTRTWKSLRKSIRKSTKRMRGYQPRRSLGDINYPEDSDFENSRTDTPPSVFEEQILDGRVPSEGERSHPVEEPDSCAVLAKWIVSFVLFSAVLMFATFSKVCFVAIASKYNDSLVVTVNDTEPQEYRKSLQDNSITFVQLVTILLAPQLFTAVRMLFSGIIGKSSTTYPWPSFSAVAVGITVSVVEAGALCGFVFLVAPHVGPPAAILLLSGVYVFTGLLGINWCCGAANGDSAPPSQNRDEGFFFRRVRRCWNGSGANFLGAFLQVFGLLGTLAVVCYLEFAADPSVGVFDITTERWRAVLRLSITVVLIPVTLSFVWSRTVQKLIHRASPSRIPLPSDGYDSLPSEERNSRKKPFLKASRRGGFLYALVRLATIPFIAYGFTMAGGVSVDIPLGFSNWSALDIAVLLLQILSSLSAFLVGLVGLWTTLQTWAFTLPLLLSTPLAVGWYWLAQMDSVDIFPFYKATYYLLPYESLYLQAATATLTLLWVGQILILGCRIWQRPRFALARERSLLLAPHLDSVFMESYLLLNRHSAQLSFSSNSPSGHPRDASKKPVIFICSTMYHEAEHEMKQMLTSINRVAQAIKENHGQYAIHDHRKPHFESHIFFDGSIKIIGKDEHFNDFVLQMMSLLEETLGVKLNDVQKIKTPYGYQMRWQVGELPFCVHLKDNSKVKNKKRWSQVMYMSYVLKYRMKDMNELGRLAYDPQYSYILTTDADIEFTAEAVKALLDFLARDDSVGAVCARTHPLGSGPLVWYQIFEYAFGHWFQKSAEHVLGCVLCCPGCFSVFRASAIADVLDTYQTNVTTASEFLTKDMGEDRWLCTLMVEKGWRLEYSALSQDSTYCPEDFNEFFNQRRRWVPSTVANLLQMITSAPKMAANNDSISYLFIIYQLIIIVSTAVSPATVILIVASGLFSAYGLNTNIVIGIISVITILFGIICVVFPEKIQLNVAKFLTVISSILMIIAFVGIFASTIKFLIPEPGSNSTLAERAADPDSGISVDSVYLWGFAAIVIAAGVLNFREFLVLLHFIWYILAIPSAYLLLLVYSAANLHVRSWGTRVGAVAKPTKQDESLYDTWKGRLVGWGLFAMGVIKARIKRKTSKEPQDETSIEETKPPPQDERFVKLTEPVDRPIDEEVLRWLEDLECKEFTEQFQSNGYTSLEFISTMKGADFARIGVRTQGHTRRLEKAVRSLPAPAFLSQKRVSESVQEFLDTLNLGQYSTLFMKNGYYLKSDVNHLLELSADNLKAMGIMPAHVKIITAGLQHMRNPTCYEIKIGQTRKILEKAGKQELNDGERDFWQVMADGVLKAEPAIANDQTDDLKNKLYGLRNSVLLAMLVVNVIWMVLLLTLNLTFFESLGINNSLLPIAFSVLYFGVIGIQFVALVVHRVETLAQYIARTNIK